MKCQQALLKLCGAIDLSLTDPSCREVKKHLEVCPSCSAFYDSLKKIIMLYRSDEPKIPQGLHRRLLIHLRRTLVRRRCSPGRKTTARRNHRGE
ncbi:MAG: anti-sigma factor family protein [Bacteroidota bacterium]